MIERRLLTSLITPIGTRALVSGCILSFGLVLPLLVSHASFHQRLTLGILLSATSWWLVPVGRLKGTSVRVGALVLLACITAVIFTMSRASREQELTLSEQTTRAGFRVLALNNRGTALALFERAMAIDPSDRAARVEIARLRFNLAENEVGRGLAADSYERAADHLARALDAYPDESAQTLSEAIARVRHADIIWNRYEWSNTVSELRRAYRLRPDLPGLGGKLYAADISAALAAIEARDFGAAQDYLNDAVTLQPDGRELVDIRARIAALNRS